MTKQGSTLQSYNNELVKCIESLQIQRNDLIVGITKEETEKKKLEDEIATLTGKLDTVNERLKKKHGIKIKYDKLIEDAEMAYSKILESSQALLCLVKKEALSFETEEVDSVKKTKDKSVPEKEMCW